MENIYYVYGLIDPYTLLPFYIGKGKGDRAQSHLKLYSDDIHNMRKRNHIEMLLLEYNQTIDIRYYDTHLTNEEACDMEIRLIRKYGRKDIDSNGILLNWTQGGEGGDTSYAFTENTRKKLSAASSGTNNAMAKLTEQEVIEIYHSNDHVDILSKTYKVSTTQIYGIKRKSYYYSVTKDIIENPGYYKYGGKVRIPITIDAVKEIYVEENTFDYFLKKYGATNQVVKNIKSGKSYKKLTATLGPAGHIIKYKLSNDDIIEIRNSEESNNQLAKKFEVHPETIYNIKSGRTRRYLDEGF